MKEERKKTIKVLMVYDILPEETKRTIVEMTDDEYNYFKKANNVIVNINDDDESAAVCRVIENAFCDNQEYSKYCETDKEVEYFGKWKNLGAIEDIEDVSKLITCGFYL